MIYLLTVHAMFAVHESRQIGHALLEGAARLNRHFTARSPPESGARGVNRAATHARVIRDWANTHSALGGLCAVFRELCSRSRQNVMQYLLEERLFLEDISPWSAIPK